MELSAHALVSSSQQILDITPALTLPLHMKQCVGHLMKQKYDWFLWAHSCGQVEAYRPEDTACHGRFGQTARTEAMVLSALQAPSFDHIDFPWGSSLHVHLK